MRGNDVQSSAGRSYISGGCAGTQEPRHDSVGILTAKSAAQDATGEGVIAESPTRPNCAAGRNSEGLSEKRLSIADLNRLVRGHPVEECHGKTFPDKELRLRKRPRAVAR